MDAVEGVTEIDVKAAGVTVKLKDPVTPPTLAVTEQAPLAFAETVPAPDTLATAVLDELQVAELVTSLVLPSL